MPSNGVGAPGRRVTMSEVAAEAGVSRQLVSLVMRNTGYVAEDKRALVLAAAERLNYRRNGLATRLAAGQTLSLGMLVLDIHNQVFADFADGALSVAEPAGYQLLLVRGSLDASSEAKAIDSLTELRVDGLLLAGHVSDRRTLERRILGTPTVLVSKTVRLPRVDVVTGDDRAGARLAVDHLVDEGHRRISYIQGPAYIADHPRGLGYAEAMTAHGLEPHVVVGDTTEVGGAAGLTQALASSTPPTALFCFNDSTAMGAIDEARRRGLRVPEDLAIVGYDNTRASSYSGIDLTSVDQFAVDIGVRAAELLLTRIEKPERSATVHVVSPSLVVRGSSRNASTSTSA